jgi:hypothetical protein
VDLRPLWARARRADGGGDPFSRPRRHPRIPTPPRLYGSARRNSLGHDLSQLGVRNGFASAVKALDGGAAIAAGPIVSGIAISGGGEMVRAPADHSRALGAALEEKFTEDELKVFVNWLESPVYRKYQQVAPEIQRNFVQKLVAEARPSIDPKLKTLEESVRNALASATSSGGAPANSAKPTPAKPAPK